MSRRSDPVRDLISVVLGLQNGLFDQVALMEAFRAWNRDPSRALTEILLAQETLTPEEVERLERLISDHLARDSAAGNTDFPTIGSGDTVAMSSRLAPTPRAAEPVPPPSTAETRDLADETLVTTPLDDATSGLGDASSPEHPTLDGGDPDRTSDFPTFTLAPPGQDSPGRFKEIRPHAEGGLGAVYIALDTELNREVALKRIKDRYADDPTSRSRFLLEAEVTGGLEHPGVVPVYGLGADPNGHPYYAMRFIRGESLEAAITRLHSEESRASDPGERGLELRKLLRRLMDVCNTVDYAHGRFVLHRDIKPANIMLGPYGETLVVDWGIAKATARPDREPEDDGRALVLKSTSGATQTLPGSAMGSPAYMSPEQAAGDLQRLGPPSDVYSLGATLYHMLTGRPAFRDKDVRRVLRAVERGDFPPPRAVDKQIDAGLEAICLKAMARRPIARYPTPRALAEDLERWMADEPISARREPVTERVRRWMRRRRATVTAAAAGLLVALVGLTVVLAVQSKANRDLHSANVRERQRFDLAMKAIRTFHSGVSEDLLLGQKEFGELRDRLLGEAREFYRQLQSMLAGQEDVESREALGRAFHEVGEVTSMISTPAEALVAHNEALRIRERLAGEAGASDRARADLGASLLAIGRLEQKTNHVDRAEALFVRARDVLTQAARERPGLGLEREQARCELLLGGVLGGTSRTEEALAAYKRASDLLIALESSNPGDPRVRSERGAVENATGRLLQVTRPEEALDHLERALAIRQDIVKARPRDREALLDLSRSYHAIAALHSRRGRSTEAIAAFEKARDLREELVRGLPAVALFQSDLGAVLFDLAREQRRVGAWREALRGFDRSREINQALVQANPDVPQYRRSLALCEIATGSLLADECRSSEALASFDRARTNLALLTESSPSEVIYRYDLAITHDNIAELSLRQGRPLDALRAYRAELALLERLESENARDRRFPPLRWGALAAVGATLDRLGRRDAAISALEAARTSLRKLLDARRDDPLTAANLARTEDWLARAHASMGDLPRALESWRLARERWKSLESANPSRNDFQAGLALSLLQGGRMLARAGRRDEALVACRDALRLASRLVGASASVPRDRALLAEVQGGLAEILFAADRPCDAREELMAASRILVQLPHRGAGEFFDLARIRGRLASLSGAEACGVSEAEAEGEAVAALDALGRAVLGGYRDAARALSDPSLDPVRDRGEFKLQLLDMAFPDDPFATPP